MREPHLLLAAGNCRKLVKHVTHILDAPALARLEDEIAANARQLIDLGGVHHAFAKAHCQSDWRQRISRLYYAAYATQRGVRLFKEGYYSTEASEHKKVGQLPDDFPNRNRYANDLATLREDRNLADYDHTAAPGDLAIPPDVAEQLVDDFVQDARTYLHGCGLPLS